jgi:integrase
MTRKSELLRSKWPEFDLDAAQWDIPAERMKMPGMLDHRVGRNDPATAAPLKGRRVVGEAPMCPTPAGARNGCDDCRVKVGSTSRRRPRC